MIAGRIRLLKLLARAGAGPVALLVGLQLVRAVVPTAQALAVGMLVAVLGRPGADGHIGAAALVAGLFLLDQAVWLILTAVRTLAVKRIDGGLRADLRVLATGLPGLGDLESREFQDRAARVVDAGMGIARERSAGHAAAGQLELMFRMLSAVAAATLLATFSPLLAAGLLAVALTTRAILRRQWLRIIDVLDADTAGQRAEYYVSETAVIGAAKDVRLFGLSDWFAGRFRAAATRTYAPVYREMLAVLRRQWWTALLAAGSAGAALAVPAAAVLSGTLDPARLITYVLAALGVLSISSMGLEAYDIEYGLRGVRAADELAARYPRPDGPALVAEAPPAPPPTIRFENVVFTYPGTGWTCACRPAVPSRWWVPTAPASPP